MKKLLTQSEFAKQRGCSQQYVSKLVQQQRITLVDGKIDPVSAEKQIQQTADPQPPQKP